MSFTNYKLSIIQWIINKKIKNLDPLNFIKLFFLIKVLNYKIEKDASFDSRVFFFGGLVLF